MRYKVAATAGVKKCPNCYRRRVYWRGSSAFWKCSPEVPQDRESVRRAAEEAVAGKAEYRVESRIRRDDGRTSLIESRGRALFDEDDEAAHLIGVGVDITARMHAEEALRQSEDPFKHPDGTRPFLHAPRP